MGDRDSRGSLDDRVDDTDLDDFEGFDEEFGDRVGDHDRLSTLLHDLRHYVATGRLLYDDGDGLREDELRARLRTGRRLFDQLSAMVDDERDAGRAPSLVDVGLLVEDTVTLFRHGHPALHVLVGCESGLTCLVGPEELHRAVTNLLENAARAAGPGGHVSARVSRDSRDVLVEVADDGRGFARIPRGTGHGLQVVSDLVHSAGGSFEIHSGADGGTRVVVALPFAETEAAR